MSQLRNLILDALQGLGYGVIESLALWNTEYKPLIKSLPVGRHVLTIGKYEITFKKVS